MGLILRWLAVGSFLLISLGCQKQEFLFFKKNNKPGEYIKLEHKLKELQGESKVDILWTIDNSASMSSYQTDVADNIDHFMNEFMKTGLEWRMGLISTDPTTNGLHPYLGLQTHDVFDHTDPNPAKRFRDAVATLGIGGWGYECAYTPIDFHLKKYPNFVRSNAILALMVVTDAPEQSDRPNARQAYNLTTKQFLENIKKIKGDISRVAAYGAFGAQDLNCPITDEQWNYKGSVYEELINATHGRYFPLCANDFGKQLATFGQDLVKRVTSPRIYLKKRPLTESIRVQFHGQSLPGGLKEEGGYWVYDFDQNAILFHDTNFAVTDNESVSVEFTEAGVPIS